MTYSAENKDAMVTCEELIHKLYKEPVDGIFEDVKYFKTWSQILMKKWRRAKL